MIAQLYIFLFASCVCGSYALGLTVENGCPAVFLNTETTRGSIRNNVNVPSGSTIDMEISDDWEGAVNIGMHGYIQYPCPSYSQLFNWLTYTVQALAATSKGPRALLVVQSGTVELPFLVQSSTL